MIRKQRQIAHGIFSAIFVYKSFSAAVVVVVAAAAAATRVSETYFQFRLSSPVFSGIFRWISFVGSCVCMCVQCRVWRILCHFIFRRANATTAANENQMKEQRNENIKSAQEISLKLALDKLRYFHVN